MNPKNPVTNSDSTRILWGEVFIENIPAPKKKLSYISCSVFEYIEFLESSFRKLSSILSNIYISKELISMLNKYAISKKNIKLLRLMLRCITRNKIKAKSDKNGPLDPAAIKTVKPTINDNNATSLFELNFESNFTK